MENQDQIIMDDVFADNGAILTNETQKEFRTIGIWSLLLAIFGVLFILMFLLSSVSFFMMFTSSNVPELEAMKGLGFLMLIMSSIFVVPVVFLFRFSFKALKMRKISDSNEVLKTIQFLKSFFLYLVISIIGSFILMMFWSMYMATQSPSFN